MRRDYGLRHIWIQNKGGVLHATYSCKACKVAYTVDEPFSWRVCSPDFCHDCYADLEKVRRLLPQHGEGK